MSGALFQKAEQLEKWVEDLARELKTLLRERNLPPESITLRAEASREIYHENRQPFPESGWFFVHIRLPHNISAKLERGISNNGSFGVEVRIWGHAHDTPLEGYFPRTATYEMKEERRFQVTGTPEELANFISKAARNMLRRREQVGSKDAQEEHSILKSLTRPYPPAQLAVLQRHDLPPQVTEFLFSKEKGDPVGKRGVTIDVKTAYREAYDRARKWAEGNPNVDQVELYYTGLTEATLGALAGLRSEGLVVYLMRYNRKEGTYERLPAMP